MDNLILVGMPCSGKTIVGQMLSERIKMEFFDSDDYIKLKTQKSIEDIFSEYGEGYFRELERDVILDEISAFNNTIVSTGGGMPTKFDNMERLKKCGMVIYLKNTVENLNERLDRKNRPLFKDPNAIKTLEELLNTRNSIYEKADIIIDCASATPEEICEKILVSINSMNIHF
jgi:shikimate kinase